MSDKRQRFRWFVRGMLFGIAICCAPMLAVAAQTSAHEYRDFARLHEGDAANGRRLFSDAQNLICSSCHTVDASAGKAGPDLYAIGDKFTRTELIDAILSPSATIANGYNTTIVTMTGDEIYTGVLKQANDAFIELMGPDGKPHRIPRGEITSQHTSEISLMPEGLQNSLSSQEFADLVEYLVSLKQPQNARMLEAGMPATIPSLTPPVELVPFIQETSRFAHPVWFGQVPDTTNVFFVLEHETGSIWRLEKGISEESKTLFVNLERYQKGTRGLLGMALHPHFAENGRYFVARHTVENGQFSTLILERSSGADLKTDSGKPSRLILKLEETSGVHYGGGMQFGPDGYFYIGMGDSGPQEDPNGNAQNTERFLGKMLRIDIDHAGDGQSYSVPSDNPFVDRPNIRPEIWALGFREPWRFSFDSLTGELWVGDVGQDRYEEVDLVHRGENYGWNVFEGFEPFSNRYRRVGERYVPPVFAYGRKFGVSVTGGYVYRGEQHSSFFGVYIFGDYQSRRVWGLTQENGRLKTVRQIAESPEPAVAFGRDIAGNLYLVGYEGMIYKLKLDGTSFNQAL